MGVSLDHMGSAILPQFWWKVHCPYSHTSYIRASRGVPVALNEPLMLLATTGIFADLLSAHTLSMVRNVSHRRETDLYLLSNEAQ